MCKDDIRLERVVHLPITLLPSPHSHSPLNHLPLPYSNPQPNLLQLHSNTPPSSQGHLTTDLVTTTHDVGAATIIHYHVVLAMNQIELPGLGLVLGQDGIH